MSRKVLVVDDEKLIVKGIRFNLEQDGMEVDCAYDGEEAVEKAKENKYDIILLDLMLPGMDGVTAIRKIRQTDGLQELPIMLLTAKEKELDKVVGLDCGADDYMVKPFSIKELLFRISALLRRIKKDDTINNNEIISLPFTLNLDKRKLFKDGKEIELTPTEFSIVKYLITNAKKSLSRDQILEEVWGSNYLYDFKIVDVNIRRIRNKIEDDPSKCSTIVLPF